MSQCILNVTPHEFDQILQLTHDRLQWSNCNRMLLDRLLVLLGRETVHDMRQYDTCRMEKHDDVTGLPRVEQRSYQFA